MTLTSPSSPTSPSAPASPKYTKVNSAGKSAVTDPSGNVFAIGNSSHLVKNVVLSSYFLMKYDPAGLKLLEIPSESDKSVVGSSMASDHSGNIVITGTTWGNQGDNILAGYSDMFVTKFNNDGVLQWTKQLGALKSTTQGESVAIDNSGNIFIVGTTFGALDGNTLTGRSNMFITMYDSSGLKQWTKQIGKVENGSKVAVDTTGNILALGWTPLGSGFITQFDSTGTLISERTIPSGFLSWTFTIDTSESYFLAKQTEGAAWDTNSYDKAFITKYDLAGVEQWTKQLTFNNLDMTPAAQATDSSENVFLVGYTDKAHDVNTLTQSKDMYVIKYDSSGVEQWKKQVGTINASTMAYGVATDLKGNVFVTGATSGSLDGNTLTGSTDMFIIKCDSSGSIQWIRQYGQLPLLTE